MENKLDDISTTTIRIAGMHCPSCDILVKTKLHALDKIIEVKPDHKSKTVSISHHGTLSLEEVNSILCEYGYKASHVEDVIVANSLQDKLQEAVIIAGIIGILYYFALELHIVPVSTSGTVTNISGAFVLGLIASASTCMATTGALFTSFINKHRSQNKSFPIGIMFVMGRLVSYGLFGFALGYFGKALTYITQFGSILSIGIALILIVTGLDMLRLVSISHLFNLLPKFNFSRLLKQTDKGWRVEYSALLLGSVTYLLPCGFTLSTQAYAMSTGNPWTSSLIMIAFAAGTIPSLIFLTLLSRIRNNNIYQYFLKVVGVIVIVVGCSYIFTTIQLHGLFPTLSTNDIETGSQYSILKDGIQIVQMTATATGYSPSQFIVKKGIPVRWEIDGKDIFGCQGTLQSPKAGIKLTYLKKGENVFEFTPTEVGIINFSCSMGMFSGQFRVIE